MKLIKLTAVMEKELRSFKEISPEQIDYLKYTRHFYLLENDKNKYITESVATFIQMDRDFDGGPYNIYLLEKNVAEAVLSKQVKPKAKPTKKVEPKPVVKKEEKTDE